MDDRQQGWAGEGAGLTAGVLATVNGRGKKTGNGARLGQSG